MRSVVYDEGGRMVAVHPDTQIVWPILAWLTEGLTAPGVRARFGSTAPAALTTMPPVLRVAGGLGVTGTVGGVVLGVLTAVVV